MKPRLLLVVVLSFCYQFGFSQENVEYAQIELQSGDTVEVYLETASNSEPILRSCRKFNRGSVGEKVKIRLKEVESILIGKTIFRRRDINGWPTLLREFTSGHVTLFADLGKESSTAGGYSPMFGMSSYGVGSYYSSNDYYLERNGSGLTPVYRTQFRTDMGAYFSPSPVSEQILNKEVGFNHLLLIVEAYNRYLNDKYGTPSKP